RQQRVTDAVTDAGQLSGRRVHRAVGITDLWTERPAAGPAGRRGQQLVQRIGFPLEVGIGHHDPADGAGPLGNPPVRRGAVADVRGSAYQVHPGTACRVFGCAVGGPVVHDDDSHLTAGRLAQRVEEVL